MTSLTAVMTSRTALSRWFIAALVIVLLIASPATAGTQTDPRKQREEVRAQRAQAAAELDVLRASDADVRAALDGLAQNVAEQEAELTAAQDGLAAAQQAVVDAEAAQQAKVDQMDSARGSLHSLALAAYAGSPPPSPIDLLVTEDESSSVLRYGLAQFQSTQLTDVVDQLRSDAQDLADLADAAQNARVAAQARQADEQSQLDQLQQARDAQAALAADLEDRIDRSMAEAASLEAIDKELSAQIAKQEAELAARLKAEKAAREKAAREKAARDAAAKAAAEKAAQEKAARDAAAKATTTTKAGSRSTTTTKPRSSTSTASGSNGSTSSTSGSSSGSSSSGSSSGSSSSTGVRSSDIVTKWVSGIQVAESIADEVGNLMSAARAANIPLGGSGFRDNSGQIALRKINCGSSDYAIWDMPSTQCSPPTARPGRSMHERGLAIDFTCSGTVVLKSDKCFSWLRDHAATYGLYNLPGEPWHWSTNGN